MTFIWLRRKRLQSGVKFLPVKGISLFGKTRKNQIVWVGPKRDDTNRKKIYERR
jgi:hypothetical protein